MTEHKNTRPYIISIDIGNKNTVVFTSPKNDINPEYLSFNSKRIFPTRVIYALNEDYAWRKYVCVKSANEKIVKKWVFDGIKEKLNNQDLKVDLEYEGYKTTIYLQQVLGDILSYLINICEENLEDIDVKNSLFYFPIEYWWGNNERQFIFDAAELAGIDPMNIILFSSCDAIISSFWFHNLHEIEEGKLFAVLDCGDSCFNLQVRKIVSDGINKTFENIYCNKIDIGGKDFTDKTVDYIKYVIENPEDENKLKSDGITVDQINGSAEKTLRKFAEIAKEKFILLKEISFKSVNVLPGKDISMMLFLDKYEEFCKDLLGKIQKLIKSMKKDIDINELTKFEVTGGCSRMPLVLSTIKECIPNKSIITNRLNADECFAEGGIIYHFLKSGTLRRGRQQINAVFENKVPYQIFYNYAKLDSDGEKIKNVSTKKNKEITLDSNKGKIELRINKECTFTEGDNKTIGVLKTVKEKKTFKWSIDENLMFNIISSNFEKKEFDKVEEVNEFNKKIIEYDEWQEKRVLLENDYEKLVSNIQDIINEEVYIENDKNKQIYEEMLKKYKIDNCSYLNIEHLKCKFKELKREFGILIDVYESYSKFNAEISQKFNECKILAGKYKKKKNPTQYDEAQKLFKQFRANVNDIRSRFEAINPKVEEITDDHELKKELKKIYDKFNEDFKQIE